MFYSPNQKVESETMEPGGPRLLAIVILLVGVITWTQENPLRSREDFTPRTWNQQHHAEAEADVTEPLTPAEFEASLNIHQDRRFKHYVESHHHNLYLKLSHTIATIAKKNNCYVCRLIPHSTTGGLPMMALPLTPCHLLAIAHTLAVPIISLNNKVDYSVFCKNYSLPIQNQHDSQPLSVAITPIAFP